MDLRKDEVEIKNFFDKFSHEFSLMKKIIFSLFFILTSIAFGYWCYMLYKIYNDNDPLIGSGATSTWKDLYHYDTHLLAAFQATVLGAFMCVIITIAL